MIDEDHFFWCSKKKSDMRPMNQNMNGPSLHIDVRLSLIP